MAVLLVAGACAAASNAPNAMLSEGKSGGIAFRDHGVAVPIAACRGVYVVKTAEGGALAIATSVDTSPRGWILVADLDAGSVEQVYCPEAVRNSPPFGSVMGSNGRFYTSQGGVFLEFDPSTRQWTFQQWASGAGAILTMAEAPDGTIWLGNVHQAGLHSFNPETREFRDHGRMDDRETYLQSIGFDDEGWVYAGIGMARENLVAYNPASGERRQLADESLRNSPGSGVSWRNPETRLLYGRVHGQTFRLSGGRAEPVEESRRPAGSGGGYGSQPTLPDGRHVTFDFAARRVSVKHPDGTSATIAFDYRTEGASIRPQALAAGADGKIYVNSGHPGYFACYDPAADTLRYFPDPHAQQCLTTQGRFIIGGRYTGGKLKVFDTTKPWNKNLAPGERANPFRAVPSSRPDINRPIVAFAHPDGVHVMIAGMPGYGRAGGGLSIYNLDTEKIEKYTHAQLIPHHSITALAALPDGNLVGSTTISGTHGGHAVEKDAVLFKLNWETKQVTWKTAPVPGVGQLYLQRVGDDGRLYCTGSGGIFLIYDLKTETLVHQDKVGGQILDLPDRRTLMLTRDAVLKLNLDTYETEKIADAPTGIGRAVVLGDRLYFISGPRLWSYRY